MRAEFPNRARLAELLADEAAGADDPAAREELARLAGGADDRDGLMTAASLVQLAFLKADRGAHAALPGALRERLARHAAQWGAGRGPGRR